MVADPANSTYSNVMRRPGGSGYPGKPTAAANGQRLLIGMSWSARHRWER
jgi:hypothetical protein